MRTRLKANLVWAGLMIFGFILIDGLEFAGIINTFIENMLVTIGINVILAIGLNLIIGFSGQFSLGHAGFMAIGAYATGIITPTITTIGGFYLSMFIGVIIAIIAALIVGIPTLRLRGDYLAIATMGAAEIIRLLINNLKITNGAAGIFNIPALASWATVYVIMCITTIMTVNFIHSRSGRAIMAIREDEIAAEAMGLNTTRWKLAAFVFGAATAAVGGSLHAAYIQTIAPSDFNIMASIAILIIVVLGGVGSITGTFVAAIVLGALDTILQNFGTLRMIIYSLALILIMIFKPAGLLGTWELSFKRFNRQEVADHE
ncbi:branched-chain amino acid ABC transporter permease [Lactiplantibacillus mudanjiangensis]|uniref:Branched-chain amino acid ABC transporter, permease protein [Lactobacillus plantarum JDM1] n=1 Tax=Lactiplantibacillus mudanjiangensis TaxID=1296538 RepID=A0A660E4F9_9LACO|nr:branched-chain amino acid ABC transporter permease [Lactiplantibacillus mudanjiangensis]VDG20207.1 branched-chain amino acid ABC transporter, permease protein [Lactobacillus plantarum JDM1] [Lactiplantibacillus mudanjiangensis]VDG24101.1 branched-chain amino acid ABC transporter, permease protein [Lactobacillus plantarum JDM1] [Lactiplantibacillus mudanjiangensis]VDG30278.1 branched-chain amino acid ABC transporter, permease protein [Lactobacillus plantarum JDM1] [Lactiplantibacillus mudanjia